MYFSSASLSAGFGMAMATVLSEGTLDAGNLFGLQLGDLHLIKVFVRRRQGRKIGSFYMAQPPRGPGDVMV
jgi:hypothetical protein